MTDYLLADTAAAPTPLSTVLLGLALLALAPFLLTVITSFAKMVIVSGIVRQAIGMPQVPPTSVITGMALVLTLYTTAPLALDIYARHEAGVKIGAQAQATKVQEAALSSTEASTLAAEWWNAARDPVADFLSANASERNVQLFQGLWKKRVETGYAEMAKRTDLPPQLRDAQNIRFVWLIPAFMLTELTEALVIGFLIYTPFLVIDLVVSNILLAVGMQMVTPNVISLPLKLLLFVLMDGWTLIYRGLVESYPALSNAVPAGGVG